ncbi:MAG: phytanoyl-CoA dioxygenase family protein [Gammaproteobacteria bacterium]|nr:phytanoyl-CoA dioxygenase family protein [Gammaproteobacteria bacterium]
MPLSVEQIAEYRENGYLLLRGLIPPDALSRYDARFVRYAEGRLTPPGSMKIMRDIMVVKGAVEPQTPLHAINKMIAFEDDVELYRYVLTPALLDAARSLIGEDLYSITSNVFNKPPGVDGRHPMHQDLRYFRIRPADKIVGAWTAILPATRESGCLAFIPGSHRGPLHEHHDPDWEYVNYAFFGIDDIDFDAREHIEMQPGDTLLFHPLLIHGSGHNRSNLFRRAISAHYASASAEAPDAGEAWTSNAMHIPLDA